MHSELATNRIAGPMAGPDRVTVAVLGLGYVGLPVALAFAEAGFPVVGIDVDAARVGVLREGAPTDGVHSRWEVTTEFGALGTADVVFVCVPTPLEAGEAQHEAVRACAAAFADHGRPDALVILESTVRPGFVEELRAALGHGGNVALAYAPERIDPQRGASGVRLRDIPRLVAGVDEGAQERAIRALRAVGVAAHPVPLRVAEYAKLLENAYRLLNVAFVDEFAALCRADGVDARAVVTAAATKPFGFHAFWPGIGAGGHCIAVDPAFLADRGRRLDAPLTLLERALEANAMRPRSVAAQVAACTHAGDCVLAVGLTYKAGVPDLRESAALCAVRALAGMNRRVLAFDPWVEGPPDLETTSLGDGLARATAVLLLVPQPDGVLAEIAASRLPAFDATGTLVHAVRV